MLLNSGAAGELDTAVVVKRVHFQSIFWVNLVQFFFLFLKLICPCPECVLSLTAMNAVLVGSAVFRVPVVCFVAVPRNVSKRCLSANFYLS